MLQNWSIGQSHVSKLINRSRHFSTVSERVSLFFNGLLREGKSVNIQNCHQGALYEAKKNAQVMPNEEVPIYTGRILTHAHSLFAPQAIYSTHLADYQNTLCASLPSNPAATSTPHSNYQTTIQPLAHYSILRRAARPHLDPDMLMVCGASNNVGEYTRACLRI
jgi:hypothetical protein